MADEYTFYESNSPVSDTEFEFASRQSVWIPDSNNGSYGSGQIQFDLANFSNSNRYIDWKSSVLTIPLCIAVTGTGMGGGVENSFAASLKNGYHQLINSLSLSLTNNEVISIQSFQNLLINYKILSSFSETDLTNFGTTLGFSRDTAISPQYIPGWTTASPPVTAPSNIGQGVCNNVIGNKNRANIYDCDLANGYKFRQNTGRLTRMLSTSSNDTDLSAFVTTTSFDNIYKNNVCQNSATTITYHILATIPMAFLHDFFLKCPLMKNAYYKLIINTNTNITIVQTLNAAGLITNTTINSPFGTNPVMLSPVAVIGSSNGDGFIVAAAANTITTTLRIVGANNTTQDVKAHPMTQCRIYGSLIEMTPQYEMTYLENKVKKIIYNDVLSFNNILNINGTMNMNSSGVISNTSGGTVNVTLTPGLSRLRRLTIFPFISSTQNGTLGNTPMNSPYATEPGTCSPYCCITNFNVLLSGQVIYNQNKQYAFENYLEECRPAHSINGGLCNGLSSGLLSQMDHDSSYGFITVNLARHTKESDNISKSVQLQFTNASKFACDFICLLEYEKEINVDIEIGAIIL